MGFGYYHILALGLPNITRINRIPNALRASFALNGIKLDLDNRTEKSRSTRIYLSDDPPETCRQ